MSDKMSSSKIIPTLVEQHRLLIEINNQFHPTVNNQGDLDSQENKNYRVSQIEVISAHFEGLINMSMLHCALDNLIAEVTPEYARELLLNGPKKQFDVPTLESMVPGCIPLFTLQNCFHTHHVHAFIGLMPTFKTIAEKYRHLVLAM